MVVLTGSIGNNYQVRSTAPTGTNESSQALSLITIIRDPAVSQLPLETLDV